MQGSLALAHGVVWLGRHARTAEIRVFDLDGRELAGGFRIPPIVEDLELAGGNGDPRPGRSRSATRTLGRSTASGLAVDGDRRLWVADEAGARVRAFNVFGAESATITGAAAEEGALLERDTLELLGRPGDVALVARSDETGESSDELLVASRGRRRHALRRYGLDGELRASLRPLGDPEGSFSDLRGVATFGELVFACDEDAGRVQVFRRDEFHFAIAAPGGGARRVFRPRAAAPLADGRLLVAIGGESSALLLLDGAGRLLRTIAEHGTEVGQVFEPGDVIVEEGHSDERTRVIVVDCDGDRVQAFSLVGRCWGTFRGLPRTDD